MTGLISSEKQVPRNFLRILETQAKDERPGTGLALWLKQGNHTNSWPGLTVSTQELSEWRAVLEETKQIGSVYNAIFYGSPKTEVLDIRFSVVSVYNRRTDAGG